MPLESTLHDFLNMISKSVHGLSEWKIISWNEHVGIQLKFGEQEKTGWWNYIHVQHKSTVWFAVNDWW